MSTLHAGLADADITPPPGLPLGGNVRADRAARGVHDALRAGVLALRDESTTVVLVALDLLFVTSEMSAAIKVAAADRWGLPPDHVLVFASHTHSGPEVSRDQVTSVREHEARDRWLARLPTLVLPAIGAALDRLQPATLDVGSVAVPGIAFNRRLATRDGTRMNWEALDVHDVEAALGPVDEQLTVLAPRDAAGHLLGLLVHFTLHPAILVGAGWLYSRDFVDGLTATLRAELGDVPVLFANGAEGNVNHIDYRAGRATDPFAECADVGRRIAAAALAALATASPVEPAALRVRGVPLSLRRRPITPAMVERAQAQLDACGGVVPSLLDGVPDEAYAAWLLEQQPAYRTDQPVRPVVVTLGPLVLAFVPGECFVEFGLGLRARRPDRCVLTVGLADDAIGYVPTRAAFDEGGYEPTFGTSTIEAGEGERMFAALADVLDRL